MPSPAFAEWQTSGLTRLAELARVHADARGTGPGRKWGTDQLNRSLFVALVAQFQTYCRDLHDDAIYAEEMASYPAVLEAVADHEEPPTSTLW